MGIVKIIREDEIKIYLRINGMNGELITMVILLKGYICNKISKEVKIVSFIGN